MCESPAPDHRAIPLGAKLKIIHLAFETHFNQNLQELNLTSPQMHILMYLDECERNHKVVNQRDIEKHMHLSNPTVTGLLQRLEAKGFVTRAVSKTDGRNKEIRQTEACRALHAEMHKRLDAQNAQMVKGMTAEELAEFNRLLDLVMGNIQR